MKARWLPFDLDGKTFVLAAFLLAGHFKADPRLAWLPVDLTLLFACLTLFHLAMSIYRQQYRIPLSLFWFWGLAFLFLPPLFWMDGSPYGTEKVLKLFSLTMLAAVAPLFLVKEASDIRRVLQAMTCLALLMGADSLAKWLLAGGGEEASPATGWTAFGSSTIALGRTMGLAFLWILLLAAERRMSAVPAIGLLAVFLLLLVGSGSRGPLLSLLAVAVLAGPLFYMKKAKQMMSFYLGLLVLGTVMAFSLSWLPPEATARIHSFLEGDLGESELSRLKAYQRSWETIGAHPLGIGWGGFAREINLWPGEARQYPHNIWLEIALEGGWLAAIGFFALVAACFVRLWRRLHSFEARALFALFLYVNLNAMVSGDINDNKLLFALGGMALAAAPDRKQTALQEGQNDVTNETDRDKGGQML